MTFIEEHSIIHFNADGELRYTIQTVEEKDLKWIAAAGYPDAKAGQVEVILGSTAGGNRPEHLFLDRADYLALAEREGWSVRPGPDGEPYPREPGRGFWGGDGVWRRGWAEDDAGEILPYYHMVDGKWELDAAVAPPEAVEDDVDHLQEWQDSMDGVTDLPPLAD